MKQRHRSRVSRLACTAILALHPRSPGHCTIIKASDSFLRFPAQVTSRTRLAHDTYIRSDEMDTASECSKEEGDEESDSKSMPE